MVEYNKHSDGIASDGFPEHIRQTLLQIVDMPGDPSPGFMERNGFVDITQEGVNRGRGVWSHPDTPNLVYKTAVENGLWQNHNECVAWDESFSIPSQEPIPEDLDKILTPIVDYAKMGKEYSYEVMLKANTEDATEETVKEVWKVLDSNGWLITDLAEKNVGILDGQPVLIDYALLKRQGIHGDHIAEQYRELYGDYRE